MRKRDPRLPGFDTALSQPSARTNRGAGHKWRCHKCGETLKSWAASERHADEKRHYRIEVVSS